MFSVFIIMNIRYDVIYFTIDDSETMPSMKGLGHKPDETGMLRIVCIMNNFGRHVDFSINKANMKGIPYTPFYTMGFFSSSNRNTYYDERKPLHFYNEKQPERMKISTYKFRSTDYKDKNSND
ncbi:hypothetical protein H8356DRAFT_1426386 [Neocallimastix lanati (nom. inval.)]|nr:hypothetical protein H8356DRAFT_1426386 [Neocallimastix sp. JGI-2020a]